MEEELKCPECRKFLKEPVLLHCGHSYCRSCALSTQVKVASVSGCVLNPTNSTNSTYNNNNNAPASSSGASDTISLCVSDVDPESDDKLSVASETDSGVVICSSSSSNGCRNSRPSSFLGGFGAHNNVAQIHSSIPSFASPNPSISTPRIPSILSPSTSGYVLVCEACRKPSFFSDENQLRNIRENLPLRRLLDKYNTSLNNTTNGGQEEPSKEPKKSPNCQWCEGDSPALAVLFCENCGYFYCDKCQPVIHPRRGPLKDHQLLEASKVSINNLKNGKNLGPEAGNTLTRKLSQLSTITNDTLQEHLCDIHTQEALTLYCQVCRSAVCCQCLGEVRHSGHEIQTLSGVVKAQKTELSQTLQLLSEKAKNSTEEIFRLKQLQDKININSVDFIKTLDEELESLIALLRARREKLAQFVDAERERKRGILKEQIGRCALHLNKTTALIQFCIELLKEPDPVAYLQVFNVGQLDFDISFCLMTSHPPFQDIFTMDVVSEHGGCDVIGNAISNRVTNQEFLWHREMRTKAEVEAEFKLTLDVPQLQYAIQTLDFAQHKVPPTPNFEASDCSAENNSVVLAWRCPSTGTAIDGFTLEIDSGRDDGVYKEVYTGADTVCTIDGLHFDTLYNARVKAFNTSGESEYSETICLQTSQVAWFQLNVSAKEIENGDLVLSNQLTTVTSTTLDYRTVLGSVGFSRGIHYWEVSVNSLEGNADIVLGVAQNSVNRKIMLGKDVHGWSVYIDTERSWFLHNDAHHGRLNSGLSFRNINNECVIGVLMDCDRGTLKFFHNDSPLANTHAFKNMPHGLYYPAFSVNRQSTITIHSGLRPPTSININPI